MALTKITRSLLNTGVSDSSDATAITIDSSENVTLAANLEVSGADVTITSNIIHAGDTNTFFGFNDADTFRIVTGGSEALRVTSNQRVGIGTNSPDSPLEIDGGSSANTVLHLTSTTANTFLAITDSNTNEGNFIGCTTDDLTFFTRNTERMRIGSEGNLAIGTTTTTNDAKLIVVGSDGKHPCIKGNDGGANGFTLLADNYVATESQLNLGVGFSSSSVILARSVKPSDSAENVFLSSQAQYAAKPVAIVLDDDGAFKVFNTDTSATTAVDSAVSLSERMTINSTGQHLQTPLGVSVPSFSFIGDTDTGMTRPTGNTLQFVTGGSERVRVTSTGRTLIGITSALSSDNGGGLDVFATGGGPHVMNLKNSDTSGGANQIRFLDGSGDVCGEINSNATNNNTTYGTSSDGRYKDVIGKARGLEIINSLNPVKFTWKSSGEEDEGLIAQEVLKIVPNAVTGSEETKYMMDYSRLVTPLIKAIQEQQKEIEELKQNSHPPKTIEEMEGYEDLINRIKELENK